MTLARRFPFITLALLTLLVGAAWHVLRGTGVAAALEPAVSLLGAPFIAGQRFAARRLGHGGLAPLAGFLIGVAPYVAADGLLAVIRGRRRRGAA